MAKKEETDGVSLWERLERPAAAPRASLTPGRIAEVAIGIADREGFAAVTMRKVAAELGVAPMAAYRHVDGKDELWALMIDRVSGELEPVEEGPGWRETLRAHALRTRDTMLRHPWLSHMPAPLFALTPNRMAAAERQMAALDGLGLDVDTMMAAFRTVNAYVHGATQSEAALRQYMAEQGWQSGDESRRGLAPQMSYLMGTGRYPTYRRYTQGAARKDDAEWQFVTGLDCVLDGVAGLVERGGPGGA
ncbi:MULTISPECIES: TetR/AcrR family transcriptional regulator [unclassified Streptomyces]|uniref:TetR/AcrR family transcriptional regulator n=1 Tax=unclassified Streptomyces TaxID=2593676 RepID=UPI0006FF3DD9|nr:MULTISPECIES: TetR/AcrR family transcriptional regulator [unclassified Streptomyces]KQX58996.1 TetR family transcriptional regulator [Streptomyces sp. Root1304]KRB00257.1 TetR family transcriptional regulator [Streptomyces sp. Root66D1]